MPDSSTDADIAAMQRLAAGDDLALNELMHRWRDKVAAFLFRMTGESGTAIDLAQETFVRLYQHRGSYSPSAAFATYLFRIASNLARNHLRWQRRHPTVSIDDDALFVPETMAPGPSSDTQMENRELLHEIETALASLPPDLRETLLLFTYEDMSYAEISNVVHCSVKAVETRIYRARQLLKKRLTGFKA